MNIGYVIAYSINYTPAKAAVTVIDAHSSRQLGTRMREHAAIFPMNRNAEIAEGAAVFSLAYVGPPMDSKADCTMKLSLQKKTPGLDYPFCVDDHVIRKTSERWKIGEDKAR